MSRRNSVSSHVAAGDSASLHAPPSWSGEQRSPYTHPFYASVLVWLSNKQHRPARRGTNRSQAALANGLYTLLQKTVHIAGDLFGRITQRQLILDRLLQILIDDRPNSRAGGIGRKSQRSKV